MKGIPTINPTITENIWNVRSLKRAPHLSILKWACHLIMASFHFCRAGQGSKQRITFEAPLLAQQLP